MNKKYRILVINPGSTSTKLGLYENKETIAEDEINHSVEELKSFENIVDQKDFRRKIVLEFFDKHAISKDSIDAIMGRGGVIKPIRGSIAYRVNKKMIDELSVSKYGQHESNLGALIGWDIAQELNVPLFIIDPVVVDELFPLARYSGHPLISRLSILHALNQKAVVRKYAEEHNKKYTDINVIVAHLGGGISVGAHRKGKTVDVNNALNGDGPFSPERSGGLPATQLVEICFSSKYTKAEMSKMIKGNGGLMAYLGTNDLREVEEKVNRGEPKETEILQAMTYQVCKEISSLIPAFQGEPVDAIILTGGAARTKPMIGWMKEWLKQLKIEIVIYPGGYEMAALRDGALRILTGEEKEIIYE